MCGTCGTTCRPRCLGSMDATAPQAGFDVLLSDGTTAHIRAIAPGDAAAVESFYSNLSRETIVLRYFSPHPQMSADEIRQLTEPDGLDVVVLVVELHDQIIAVAQYYREPGQDEAEVAFLVDDRYQGHGIGTILLEYLAQRSPIARNPAIRGEYAHRKPQDVARPVRGRVRAPVHAAMPRSCGSFWTSSPRPKLGLRPTPATAPRSSGPLTVCSSPAPSPSSGQGGAGGRSGMSCFETCWQAASRGRYIPSIPRPPRSPAFRAGRASAPSPARWTSR